MTKSEMTKQIVGSITGELRGGSHNGAFKETLDDDAYDAFCKRECDIADQLDRRYKTGIYGDK